MPAQLPGTQVPPPTAPTGILWTIPIPAAAITSPVITGELVLIAHLPGIVAAYHQDDGHEVWRAALDPTQPLATDGTLLFVSAGDAIHAIRLSDGAIAWRSPAPGVTAPLLVKDGWLIAATEGRLTARRASDGSTVWEVEAGVQREAAAISGDVLFLPHADGRIVARNLRDGSPLWERRIGGSPVEPLAIGDEVFVGAADRRFYCLAAATGRVAWSFRVGASVRGRASSDGERVFFAALDNLVRALDRTDGGLRWQKGLPFRPLAGPVALGGSLFIAGSDEVRVLRATDGTDAGNLNYPASLSLSPGFAETPEGLLVAAATGGLEEAWSLSLSLVSGARRTAVDPKVR